MKFEAWVTGLLVGGLIAGGMRSSLAREEVRPAEPPAGLVESLRAAGQEAGGSVGIAVIHVETNRMAVVDGDRQLPLFSVFKLPVAVEVLKQVEAKRLRLTQKVPITAADIVPGYAGNTRTWKNRKSVTVRDLLAYSIQRSDNTATDKLLSLVGGPAAVQRTMRKLGFEHLLIRSTTRHFVKDGSANNMGTAADIARLLARLHQGEVLAAPQRQVLLDMMQRATTGLKRLRGDLPSGTVVADKTGTGEDGAATHDVGLITLPHGKGHLAIAVLISGSKLPQDEQEHVIARVARAAFDAFTR